MITSPQRPLRLPQGFRTRKAGKPTLIPKPSINKGGQSMACPRYLFLRKFLGVHTCIFINGTLATQFKKIETESIYEKCPLPPDSTVVIVDVHPEIASKLTILHLSLLLTWNKSNKYRKQTNG